MRISRRVSTRCVDLAAREPERDELRAPDDPALTSREPSEQNVAFERPPAARVRRFAPMRRRTSHGTGRTGGMRRFAAIRPRSRTRPGNPAEGTHSALSRCAVLTNRAPTRSDRAAAPSARPRRGCAPKLPVERGGVLLDRVRGEEELLGDLAVRRARADEVEHLALALGQPRTARGRLVRAEDGHAQADHPDRAGDVGRRPVLGDEAGGAGRAGGVRVDPARAGDQQHVRVRRLRAQALADLRAGLLADEQVDQRDVRLVAREQRHRLVAVARAEAALDPRLLAEHQPQAPVHDLVVVDDEHAQLALARARRDPAGFTSGTLMRHRQSYPPDPRLALPELDEPADLQRLERREPQAHPGDRARAPAARRRCRPPSPTRRPGARASPRRASASRACARCAPPRPARTGRAARAPPARRPPRCRRRARCRARGARRCSRATSSANVVSVAGALRPSGRCSARRRSRSAAWSSTVTRSRASAGSGASLETTSSTPNSRWITPSCTSRARSIRSCSWRARACWNVACRAASASAEVLPSVQSRSRSSSVSGAARAPVGEDHPAPAPARRQRAADERRVVEQVAEGLGHLARDRLGVHLDHAVLLQRLARDRRRLHGHARVREALEVEPEGARGAHAPVRLVVAEDHRAVHRGEPADRLAERRVEAVGGPVGLHAREQLDERLERVDAHDRGALLAHRRLRSVPTPHHPLPGGRATRPHVTRTRNVALTRSPGCASSRSSPVESAATGAIIGSRHATSSAAGANTWA